MIEPRQNIRQPSSNDTILLDVSRLIWRAWRGQLPTGIDRLCLGYVRHYKHMARAVLQRGGFTHVMDTGPSKKLFALLLDPPADLRKQVLALLGRSLPCGLFGGEKIREGTLYLNVGHTGLDRKGHKQWVKRTKVRAIYYVHDLIPITHPQYNRAGEAERHTKRMETVLTHGAAIIANSQDSLAHLGNFAAARGFDVPPTLCSPTGLEPLEAPTGKAPLLNEPYFVVLSTIEGRKNHILLLNVWQRLAEQLEGRVPKLVIIGRRGWAIDDVIEMLDHDEVLRPHVIELSHCDDKDLPVWLFHAQALLFPSFVEGLGLPLMEALAFGTPAIASDLDVYREFAGSFPDYLDPNDEDAWLALITEYAAPDSPRAAHQRKRLVDYCAPSWEEHFARVDEWLGLDDAKQ